MKPWDSIISADEQRAYAAAGFGRPSGMGHKPALLIIDVQYRTVGTTPRPFWEAIKEFPTSCGDVGWNAVAQIDRLGRDLERVGEPALRQPPVHRHLSALEPGVGRATGPGLVAFVALGGRLPVARARSAPDPLPVAVGTRGRVQV